METIARKDFTRFIQKVAKARLLKGLPELHHHDLEMYCQTLINGAGMAQLMASMACSDRLDLVDCGEFGGNPVSDALIEKFATFSKEHLGLELVVQGDPRGVVFKLEVDPILGDSWGDRTHLCVPCVDAYQCF